MSGLPQSLRESLEASKAEYRRLGKSGLQVSVPILGAMSFGDPKWQPWVLDEEKAMPLLKAAYDRGLNTWDTSNNYSNGASEIIIGKTIKKYSIPRQKVVILTKCFGAVGEEPAVNAQKHRDLFKARDYVNQYGLSRQSIFNAVEASLIRLQTSYIDLLQIHRFDASTPIEETMQALHDLVRSGKVRYIGGSSMWAFQFAMMQSCAEKHDWTKFISMQNHYSLIYREEEREMNQYCNLTGVGLIPWGPLARGHLARPYTAPNSTARSSVEQRETTLADQKASPLRYPPAMTDADEAIIKRVEELAKKKDWAMAQVSLAWINKRVSSPIIGFSSVARMDEALAARDKELSKEEEDFLEEPYLDRMICGHR